MTSTPRSFGQGLRAQFDTKHGSCRGVRKAN